MSLSTTLDNKQEEADPISGGDLKQLLNGQVREDKQVGSKSPGDGAQLVGKPTTCDNDDDDDDAEEQRKLAELYQATKDENELLEFKNYELLFKIQELELKQKKITGKLEQSALIYSNDPEQEEEEEEEETIGIDLVPDEDVVESDQFLFRTRHLNGNVIPAYEKHDCINDNGSNCVQTQMKLARVEQSQDEEHEDKRSGVGEESNNIICSPAANKQRKSVALQMEEEKQQVASRELGENNNNNNNSCQQLIKRQQHLRAGIKSISSSMRTKQFANSKLALAKSQPNLAPQVSARRVNNGTGAGGGGARIAVPVSRRALLSSGQEQHSTNGFMKRSSSNLVAAAVTTTTTTTQSPAIKTSHNQQPSGAIISGALRTRSKSSLDQSASSLPRRRGEFSIGFTNKASNSSSNSQQQQPQPQANHSSLSITQPQRSKGAPSIRANSIQFKQHNEQQEKLRGEGTQGNIIGGKLMPPPPPTVGPVLRLISRSKTRSRSSSSIGFVTHIPTLISQSHAPPSGQNSHLAPGAPNVDDSELVESEELKQQQKLKASINKHSRSMSNLAPHELKKEEAEGEGDGDGEPKAEISLREEKQDALHVGHYADVEGERTSGEVDDDDDDDESTRVLPDSSLPVGANTEEQKNKTGSSLAICSSSTNKSGSWSLLPKASSNSMSCVSLTRTANIASDQAPTVAPSSGRSVNSLANSYQEQQQLKQQCGQCRLLQAKLNLLIKDRKQLNEQLNELEEMENDSRLMSQKLAKQLLNLEQQLDSCKLELDKTCDSEARLQFHNKRLTFELEQKCDSLEQLESQVGRLQSRLLKALASKNHHHHHHPSPVVATQKAPESSESSEQPSANCSDSSTPESRNKTIEDDGANSKDNNNNNNNNNGFIDSACNNSDGSGKVGEELSGTETSCRQIRDSTTQAMAQSTSRVAGGVGRKSLANVATKSPAGSAKVSLDHSPALSLDGDDDSAIDVFEKMELAAPSSGGGDGGGGEQKMKAAGNSNNQIHHDHHNSHSHNVDHDHHHQAGEDSAYSKSSASSDANSDDGHRSDSDQQTNKNNKRESEEKEQAEDENNDQEQEKEPNNNNNNKLQAEELTVPAGGNNNKTPLAAQGANKKQAPIIMTLDHCSTTTTTTTTQPTAGAVTQKLDQQQQLNLPSSSSSGDESDHHEQAAICNGNNNNGNRSPFIESVVGGGQEPSPTTALIGSGQSSQLMASTIIAASGNRQQVLRKKVSTARVSRSISQQQQQQPSSCLSQCDSIKQIATTTTSSIYDNQQHQRPAIKQSFVKSADESPITSGGCVQQQVAARLAQVIESSGSEQVAILDERSSDKNEERGQLAASPISSSNFYKPSDRQQQDKSSIDLALEGVEQLERGRTDEALRALTLALAPKVQSNLCRAELNTPPELLAPSSGESAQQTTQKQRQEIESVSNLIGQFRDEIENLKMRLFQAHTLNDNLVAELKSKRNEQEKFSEQREQSNKVVAPIAQQRQRSVVYVNGFGASPSTVGAQQSAQQRHLAAGSSTTQQQPAGQLFCQQQHMRPLGSANNCCCCLQPCINMVELIELLKLLLDKIHFHHGRTFQMVNECQKLALNALLASYTHQTNLVHHNGAVVAGNQSSARSYVSTLAPSGGDIQNYSQQQQVATGAGKMLSCPVRPPPRRRNASSRMIGASEQADIDDSVMLMMAASNVGSPPVQVAFDSISANKNQNFPATGLLPPPDELPKVAAAAATTTTDSSGSLVQKCATVSALQVAKQTLFSIVPIYHNSGNGNKNNKETKGNNCNLDNNNSVSKNYNSAQHNNRTANNNNSNIAKQFTDPSYISTTTTTTSTTSTSTTASNTTTATTTSTSKKQQQTFTCSNIGNKLASKSKSWILLSSTGTKQQQQLAANCKKQQAPSTQTNAELADCNGTDLVPAQQKRENVSILQINRQPQMFASQQNLDQQSQQQLFNRHHNLTQQDHNQAFSSLQTHHEFNITTTTNNLAFTQQQLQEQQHHQQLIKVKNSISEDIERYRVRFNGQLLDLLTRQNWCESIISDKLKIYQATIGQSVSTTTSSSSSCSTLNRHSIGSTLPLDNTNYTQSTTLNSVPTHFRLMQSATTTPSQANCHSINHQQHRLSLTNELPINSISLNPNGSGHASVALQHQQNICINQNQSSFC